MVVFMRHGDRGDRSLEEFEQKKLEKKYDCHLTDLGKIQAEEAGKYIKQELIQKNLPTINKVKVVSSPFLRCIMTSENTVKGLDLPVVNSEIEIHNGVSECLTLDVLQHDPFELGLVSHEPGADKKIHDIYIDSPELKINDTNRSQNVPKFPEGHKDSDCFPRVQQGFENVVNSFFEDKSLENCLLLVVSHGGCVNAILEKMNAFDSIKMYPLTNLNALLFENQDQEQHILTPNREQGPQILCKQSDEHLAAADLRYSQRN